VIVHNLSWYDSYFFIKKLKGKCEDKNEKIKCIPKYEDNYITFSREVVVDSLVKDGKNVLVKRDLRFIDSFRFMASSFDTLSKNLGSDQCMNMNKYYKGEQFELLRKKWVYPYEWTDIERLSDGELPPKEAFYSKLNECVISDEAYTHAQNVWNSFKCKTF